VKEGILLYVTQGKTVTEEQLSQFVEMNSLGGVPVIVSSQAEGMPTFYEAYKSLGRKGVDIVECFSAKLTEEEDLELLQANITLPVGIDLLKFCTPEELGLGDEMGGETTESQG